MLGWFTVKNNDDKNYKFQHKADRKSQNKAETYSSTQIYSTVETHCRVGQNLKN